MDFANICNEWNKGRLPIVNGIIHHNGYIDRLAIDYDKDKRISTIINSGRISIDSLFSDEENYCFTEIGIFCKTASIEKNISVYSGGGSFGGDGFIVVESNESRIIWIASFDWSNEFTRCEIIENNIVAFDNSGDKWVFDIGYPYNIIIETADWKYRLGNAAYTDT